MADIALLTKPESFQQSITGTANVQNACSQQLRKNTYNDPDAKVCMRFTTSGDWRLNLPVWQDANMSSRLSRESTLQADVSGIHLMKPKASLQAHRNTDWLQRNNDVTSQHTGNQCKTLVTYYATCRIWSDNIREQSSICKRKQDSTKIYPDNKAMPLVL